MEKTLVIIKPEAVRKRLVGKIFSIYEDNHLEIVHAHKVLATKEVLMEHYHDLHDKPFFPEVLSYMTSSPIIVLIIEGENAVSIIRDLHGATNPAKSLPGTIRYMFGTSIQENAVHGSESIEAAEREINIWKELIHY